MRTDFEIDHRDKQQVEDYIRWFKEQEGVSIIHHQPKTDQRSASLNNYYFGVVLKYISDASGHTPSELHAEYKKTFLKNVLFTDDYDLLSTTNCDNEQMWRYIMMIKYDAEMFFYIPGKRRQFRIPDPKAVIVVPAKKKTKRAKENPGPYIEENDDQIPT